MKKLRGEFSMPNRNAGMRDLVESAQTQAISNQHYLELKYLSDKNKHTSKCRKRKLGGKPFVVGLGSRSLHWKSKTLEG